MKRFLDRFILYFPVLFIKQYPYAWIAGVALWSFPPNISAVFFLVVLLGIFSIHWREAAWISEMRRQHAPHGETFHLERLPVPMGYAVRNIALLIAVSLVLALFFDDLFRLGYLQTVILFIGFAICYLDVRFFGAVTIYLVTGGGIGIYYVPGHTDYRLFIPFKEINDVRRFDHIDKPGETWSILSRLKIVSRGILLVPRSPRGFTRMLDGEILLTPMDMDNFLQHVPSTLISTN
jgi:hypothetical protein